MPKRPRGTYRPSVARPYRRAWTPTRVPRRARPSKRRNFRVQGVHTFTRYAPAISYSTTAGTAEYDVGMHFKLDDVVNVTEFTQLFDRYRINKVRVSFQLVTNPDSNYAAINTAAANTMNIFPKIWYTPDRDDANPITLSEMRERQDCKYKVLRPNANINFNIKPAVLLQTYRTALTTGYAPKTGIWIDCGQPEVPHYGMKFIIDNNGLTPLGQSFIVRMEKKYFFSLKDVR